MQATGQTGTTFLGKCPSRADRQVRLGGDLPVRHGKWQSV
jgi:hypothetical protein